MAPSQKARIEALTMHGRAGPVPKTWWNPPSPSLPGPEREVAKPFLQSVPKAIQILVAHNSLMFREGLQKLLESESGLRVVGHSSNCADTLMLAARLKPHVLLIDPETPDLDDFIQPRDAAARVIMLADSLERGQIAKAIRLRARGLVLKNSGTQVLVAAVRAVMAGQQWMAREVIPDLGKALRNLQSANRNDGHTGKFGLTARELQIVAAILSGCTNKDIADRLALSPQTVKHHLANIFDKLGVSSRLELALHAAHHRLIEQR